MENIINRTSRLQVTATQIASIIFGLMPFLAAAQPPDILLPSIQITPLSQPVGVATSPRVQILDPRMDAIAEHMALAADEIKSNRSRIAAVTTNSRTIGTSNTATTSRTANLMSRKAIRLVGNGPGMPIAVLESPKYEAKFSRSGTIRAVTALPGQVLQQAVSAIGSESHTQTIHTFFRAQQSSLGLVDPENELKLHFSQTDGLGHSHYRYQQSYKGIPVWGAELIAQLNSQGDLISINGAYSRTPIKLTIQPTISKEQALFSVKSKFQSATNINEPDLIIFAKDRSNSRLAWHFEFDVSAIESRLVIVDAHDGSELLSINQVQTGQASGEGVDLFGQTRMFFSSLWEDSGIYYLVDTTKPMFDPASTPPLPSTSSGVIVIADAANSTDLSSSIFLVGSDSGPTGPWLPDGVSAAVNLSATYDYYFQRLGRNSLDGNGGNMLGIVRLGQGLSNALFNPSTQTMYFGDAEPFAGALDVVAHEMGHGVIENSARLQYFGQSGALNEGFADIFGEMAEQHFNQASPDWIIGTKLSSPIRNMMDPGAIEFFPGRPYPNKMSEYVWPNDPVLNNFADRDNNGVHFNSSIINHAFYLLTNGPNGISLLDAERIFYRALTTKLSALSEFVDMRFASVQSAEELFGPNSPQTQQTEAAFDAVEIFDAPTNPTPSSFPGVAGEDGTLFVYWDSALGAYYLGRLDPSLGDTAPGIQLSASPVGATRPSASGNGVGAIFVNAQQDFCLIDIDAPGTETCANIPGQVASVAWAPDGDRIGVVFLDAEGNPANVIGVISVASGDQQILSLVAPLLDGASSIDVIRADAMDFTSDNRFIVYDAFNAIDFDDGSSIGLWSIYAIDLVTNGTISLTTPTPGFDTAYPNIAQTSDAHLVFDILDLSTNENIVVAANVYTGDIMGIASTGPFYSVPVYTGDDTGIVFSFEDPNQPTEFSLGYAPLAADRITPSGDLELWLADADFASIYRRGTFTSPPDVDIGVNYTGGVSSGHAATFNLEVANNGLDQATNVRWNVSVPPNVDAVVSNYGGTNCTVLADRIECQTTEINAGFSNTLEFRYTLASLSSSGEVTSSVTAFADQPDPNSQDNTALASVSEASLNATPTVVSSIADQILTEGVSADFTVSSNFDDSDGDQLMFSATGLPASLSIDATSGSISGTPTIADVGNTFVVTVSATDLFGASASDSFNINIVPFAFSDVQPDHWAFPFIMSLYRAGITRGCGNDNFCPSAVVTRAQMAVFLERGMRGDDYRPPRAAGNVFNDVPSDHWAADFIEQFSSDGITSGCGNNNFCPDAQVTRAQMAVFLLRAKYGSGHQAPPATGIFDDVPINYWVAHWIEQLAAEGITSGCGNNNYCPEAQVTRDQMAVFLVRTFGL